MLCCYTWCIVYAMLLHTWRIVDAVLLYLVYSTCCIVVVVMLGV